MNYSVDIPSLFERFKKTMDIYCGRTVFYRVCKFDDKLDFTHPEYYTESFTVVGFVNTSEGNYAACLLRDTVNSSRIGKLAYIPASEFEAGNIYNSYQQVLFALRRLEESCPE